jgi:hypothetical protein
MSGELHKNKPAKDGGTKELRRMRAWLAGSGDPALTSYPLGILLANGEITQAQHGAGCRYAFLHAVVFGRPSIAAVSFERVQKGYQGEWNDEWLVDREQELRGLSMRLKGHPARLRMVLDNLVIYERMPRWMQPVRPRLSDCREAGLFVKALKLLSRTGARGA